MATNLRAAGVPDLQLRELDSRLPFQIRSVLALFDRLDLKATFFCAGPVADACPDLLDRIRDSGHGIACHGHQHLDLRITRPDQAEQDLEQATLALGPWLEPEGRRGFRAPDFSLDMANNRFRQALVSYGYSWSSSIMQARQPGLGTGPLALQQGVTWRDPESGLWELPLGGQRILGIPLAHGGGFWLRVLPLFLNRAGLEWDRRRGALAQIYLHPWEMDPEQPKLVGGWRGFRHYFGQAVFQDKVQELVAGVEVRPLEEAWPDYARRLEER